MVGKSDKGLISRILDKETKQTISPVLDFKFIAMLSTFLFEIDRRVFIQKGSLKAVGLPWF